MKVIKKEATENFVFPGRMVRKYVGKDAVSKSEKMTMGFASYCEEVGAMEPHHHAEELIYVVESKDAWVRFGQAKDELGDKQMLESGMTLHFEELEWHVFEYDKGGFLDVLYFYGQTENIRPEEIDVK